jgi:hypothetical protein
LAGFPCFLNDPQHAMDADTIDAANGIQRHPSHMEAMMAARLAFGIRLLAITCFVVDLLK